MKKLTYKEFIIRAHKVHDEGDEHAWNKPETPEERWARIRKWVDANIIYI